MNGLSIWKPYSFLNSVSWGVTLGYLTEEMIKEYLNHHFEPKVEDNFRTEDETLPVFKMYPGLSVRNANPPNSVGVVELTY